MDMTNHEGPAPDADEPRKPLYHYTATIWMARTYDVVAENDEALEMAVGDAMMDDGLDPDEFPIVRMHSTRTPIHWQ